MNIVKGVADLIRRTSGGQSGESASGIQHDKSPPAPKIRFSETGDEAVLSALWDRYEGALNKADKRKLFHVFLKQFLFVFKNWEPLNGGHLPEVPSTTAQPAQYSSNFSCTVVGCFAGHPAEFILTLIEELTQLIAFISELNSRVTQPTLDVTGASANIASEGLPVLDALRIVMRSIHNCRVFGYYRGIQKLTALLKGVVVQFKTMTSAFSAESSLTNATVEGSGLLQQVLVHVVSIMCSFIDFNPIVCEKARLYSNTIEFSVPRDDAYPSESSKRNYPFSDARLHWHQKAVVSVMEAGGLNWLVELLRVIRRLSMKEQCLDISLQYLTLRTLCLALFENSRGQNHFKSIGGLEVLLDGLGLPSLNLLQLSSSSHVGVKSFGNLNNLQFLCENGRVHKFANSFCAPAFLFQDYKQQIKSSSVQDDFPTSVLGPQLWNDYVSKLSNLLCSFLLASEDDKSTKTQASSSRIPVPVCGMYSKLSIKWIMRVLLTIFPCIKACSDQSDLPSHLRVFVNTLQNCVINAFKKVMVSSPGSLELFREECIWDLIFSENFFYFGPTPVVLSEDCSTSNEKIRTKTQLKSDGFEIIQLEVISFVEFVASSSGSTHNLPELSALVHALENCVCNPEIASVLAKSLLRILQLSSEKAVASFKTLDAVSRVLKVACIQAQEVRRPGDVDSEKSESWRKCMKTCIELFMEFFSVTDDSRNYILHNTTCIDYLFELFWEEGLRNCVLRHVIDLMKIVPQNEEDQKAKLQLCSKYLETFTQIKEREKSFAELSIDLLSGMKNMLISEPAYYQALFRDGECFLHVVSLLNGNLDEINGEKLVLSVLETLTCLLASNDSSKGSGGIEDILNICNRRKRFNLLAAFRSLVGKGYQTLQSLLLDFCRWRPSEGLLSALLDMLVDGKFDLKENPLIKNEDVIILYLSVLQKSSDSLRHSGLNVFQQLLRDSISNRASCVRAGMLSFLLDWFSQEENDSVILKIAQLIQVIGGHSISGKDIRKIFTLLRSEKIGTRQQYCSLLLTTLLSMLNEKGPTAFFDLNGKDSGIIIKTPIQWPVNKGFAFSCWLRVENFPRRGAMGLFSFLTENGKGCWAALAKDKLIFEANHLKRQCIELNANLVRKKWHFLCITHIIRRAFSGGSLLRCYVDGALVSSEKCSYSKITEPLTSCSIGAKINFSHGGEDASLEHFQDSCPFLGQIGPVYLFNDAISPDQVQGVQSLGPSYMYSFLDKEAATFYDGPLPTGVLDAKDGLASKIVFGLNAQASDGRKLFNVSPMIDQALDKNSFEAAVMVGTQLCSRRLLQQIIYCVGGVSVLFPLITQSDKYENEETGLSEPVLLTPITKERLTAEVIEIIASVLDDNLANQQQMLLLSGFSILGFLLQSVPPQQLNFETLSALKHLFNVVANSSLAEMLVKDAISSIFLNPLTWLYTVYKVQRELYMFLIQQFDNDPRLLSSLCRLPRVIDIIRQFYWDNMKSKFAVGSKPLLHPVTKQAIGERPTKEEIRKIRLLLLSLGEMSLRQNIAAPDIKALVAFLESSQDMTCVEDVLHMVIRAVSQKPLLASFLEQVNLIGGCQLFMNLLQREYEPVRSLGLQFLGRLLVGLPSEKKGSRFFNLAVGRTRSISDSHKKSSRIPPIFLSISDRLFRFPLTDNLRATLFDVLLGGASPKQVLQKHNSTDKQKIRGNSSHFFLPQMLVLIFRFLSGCKDVSARIKVMGDVLDLLDSNPSNMEALMEYGWHAWLTASVQLDVLKVYKPQFQEHDESEVNEQHFVRSLYCLVLCYYVHSVKGGWQQLEETVSFLLIHFEKGGLSCKLLLRDIYGDLILKLVELSSEENVFTSQPCRDNALYLLRLVDEMLISEIEQKLPFPACSSEFSPESLELESHKDYSTALYEVLHGEVREKNTGNVQERMEPITSENNTIDDAWWHLYDNLWIIISEMNGKGPSKMLTKSSSSPAGPSLGQRARGLVESLNIPAAEMAASVVSGGIGTALGGKPNKNVDKAMLLRGERFPRVVFRLVILYLCRASLERASRCVQQIISFLPTLLAVEDEQSKSRLQLFIGTLLAVRSRYGMLDDGARFHVIAHLIRETVSCGKSVLASSIMARDDAPDSGTITKDSGSFHNIIQKDRVLAAASEEAKYIEALKSDRTRQLRELHSKSDESTLVEFNSKKLFEDETQTCLNIVLASDETRRVAFRLSHDEEQQNVAEKWIHMFRSLIDERGPWSANPFPNSAVRHWKLDKTEDAWRRRPKLRQNYHFNEKLCLPPSYVPDNDGTPDENKSSIVGHIPEQMKQFLLKGIRRITDEGSSEPGDNECEPGGLKASNPDDPLDSQCSEPVRSSEQDRRDSSTGPQESEASEVLISVPCVLVNPKRKLAGHLAVKKSVLHFFGEFLAEGTAGCSVFNNFQASSNSDPTKSDNNQKSLKWPSYFDLQFEKVTSADSGETENSYQRQLKHVKRHRRWNIGKIKAVHWTRYLLRYTAIEIFFCDSVAPVFLNFASQKNAKDVGTLIVATRNEFLFPRANGKDKSGAITFVDRRVALDLAENARESWRRRDISNFEYLMILNTLAGRSFNDLTQYPVFPWVIADYSSEDLDFNKSSTFRDLSKPVGALDLKRFEVFEDRYRNFCDPDIPSFYYGSHYSSMGIVLYYLLRLEPFTSLHRNLQY
ncbi:hypothetical protein ACFE04_025864 [Oxalis oulophora]